MPTIPPVPSSLVRRLDGGSTEAAVQVVITAEAAAGYYLSGWCYASWLWLFFNPSQ